MQGALKRLDQGKADFLLAVRLDRVSRSVADYASLLDRSKRRGWGIVLLSPNIDTSDPAGTFTSNVLASAAQYERELIGARTREGMAQRKAEGAVFGRAVADDMLPTYRRIGALHRGGLSINGIARRLSDEGVPTANGGQRWYASTVKAVLESQTLVRLAV
jgi:DNA invertase Pin-like site-specific DNA recombinase